MKNLVIILILILSARVGRSSEWMDYRCTVGEHAARQYVLKSWPIYQKTDCPTILKGGDELVTKQSELAKLLRVKNAFSKCFASEYISFLKVVLEDATNRCNEYFKTVENSAFVDSYNFCFDEENSDPLIDEVSIPKSDKEYELNSHSLLLKLIRSKKWNDSDSRLRERGELLGCYTATIDKISGKIRRVLWK